MSGMGMSVRMTGVHIIAWSLRHMPRATNWAADQIARRVASPIVRRTLGREYRLSQTRFEARIYNYERHKTPEQKIEQEKFVNEGVKSFWGGLKEYLPTLGEAVLTLRPILTGAAPPNLSVRKDNITFYVRNKLSGLAKTPHGLEIVYGVGKNTPKEVYNALISSNLYAWFTEKLDNEIYRASSTAKRPWEFWNPEMLRDLPPNFHNRCWGTHK